MSSSQTSENTWLEVTSVAGRPVLQTWTRSSTSGYYQGMTALLIMNKHRDVPSSLIWDVVQVFLMEQRVCWQHRQIFVLFHNPVRCGRCQSNITPVQTPTRWQVSDQRGLTRPVASWLRLRLLWNPTNRIVVMRRLQTGHAGRIQHKVEPGQVVSRPNVSPRRVPVQQLRGV